MKTTIIIILSLFTISCTQNSLKLVKTLEKLHNLHDIEGAMSLYHNEIEFEIIGTWIKSGKEEIRELEEWDRALNSNLKFESIYVKGDSVFCKVIEKNDWFKAVGIQQIVHDPTIFVVSNGLIKKIIANPKKEVGEQIGAIIGSIYSWSNITNDNTINELIKDGEFIYSEESAKKWLKLLKKWNDYNTENKND
jgi:hypothetical protein